MLEIYRQLKDAEVDLTCNNCGLTSNLAIGVDFQVDILDPTCTNGTSSCFTLNTAAMNLTVQELALTTLLELSIGKELSAGTSYR